MQAMSVTVREAVFALLRDVGLTTIFGNPGSTELPMFRDFPADFRYLLAMQPPRGPTFVSVPVDDWDRSCTPLPHREVSITVGGDPSLLARAASMLSAARRPALVVGASVARDAAWTEVIALAERHQAPVWASPLSSRNSFPERHPLFAGFLPADREQIVARLQGCDLILVLGAPVFTYHVEGEGPHVA